MADVPTREEFNELFEAVRLVTEAVHRLENPPPEAEVVEVTLTRAEPKAIVESVPVYSNEFLADEAPRVA